MDLPPQSIVWVSALATARESTLARQSMSPAAPSQILDVVFSSFPLQSGAEAGKQNELRTHATIRYRGPSHEAVGIWTPKSTFLAML